MKVLFTILLATLFASCAHGPPPQRNAELIVTYEGTEVHRAGTPYKSLRQFEKILKDTTKTKYVIFSARWCDSCKFLNRALRQSGHWGAVTLIDIDEPWVRALAGEMQISNVPTMVVINKNDTIANTFIGPSAIIMHLLINVDK